jgi:ferric-dicitrate binding protein FerR (iron transport regulator)
MSDKNRTFVGLLKRWVGGRTRPTVDATPEFELLDRWLEGSLSAAQQSELAMWLKKDPKRMRRFVEANLREQMWREAARGVLVSDEVRERTPKTPAPASRSIWRSVAIVASLAAGLLVAVTLFQNRQPKDPTPTTVADLAKDPARPAEPFVSIGMLHQTDGVLRVGQRLAAQTIEVQQGLIQLLFDDGVEVTLEGPARYELIGPGRTRLYRGLLAATVPPGAEGFRVNTDAADVIDLGTAFAIKSDRQGNTLVAVFDGNVEVKRADAADLKNVREGESIRVGQTQGIQTADFNTARFEKIWPVASGIANSTGAFRFATPWPRPMGLMQSDTEIFVLPEGYARTLDEPLQVNTTTTGEYRQATQLTSGIISAGTRVKCFLLQFRPNDERSAADLLQSTRDLNDVKRIVGEIKFDRPVLGLILHGDELRSSDGLFSQRGGQVPQKARGLELGGTPRDDVVSLSADRRTVKLDLAAFGIFCDQVRVIVDQSLMK